MAVFFLSKSFLRQASKQGGQLGRGRAGQGGVGGRDRGRGRGRVAQVCPRRPGARPIQDRGQGV